MPFNPFDKAIGEQLTPTDLQQLIDRSVAEGYFIEYKGDPPANHKMGKSVASFANTYGGWYIVGVTTDAHNMAKAIPGFHPSLCPDPIARIREVIKTHISPSPMFLAQVVTLPSGNLVLVVYVPEGQDSPFISQDGRIYRRKHDSSDPIPEADRYAVDRLVEQGRKSQEQFARLCKDERVFSKDEGARAWASIYVQPYPLWTVDRRHKTGFTSSLDEAIALSQQTRTIPLAPASPEDTETDESRSESDSSAQSPNSEQRPAPAPFTVSGNIPLTSGMLTSRSIVLRQIDSARVGINAHISVEFFWDGSAKFHFELPIISSFLMTEMLEGGGQGNIKHDSVRESLLKLLNDDKDGHGITRLKFVDVATLWATVAFLVTYYQAWLGDEPTLNDVKVAISLTGVWRSCPFLDANEWADYLDKYGLPVLQQDDVWVPANVRYTDPQPYTDLLWLRVCALLQLALGFPNELLPAAVIQVADQQQTVTTPPDKDVVFH